MKAAGGADVFPENLFDAFAQHQIGVADNSRANLRLALGIGRARVRNAFGEFGFTDRAHRFRTPVAVHRAGLDKHQSPPRCVRLRDLL